LHVGTVITGDGSEVWARGIDGLSFDEKIFCNFWGGDEDAVVASEVYLVNGAVFYSPFCEFEPWMLRRE